MVASFLHLNDCPAAQNHAADFTVVDLALAAFPVGCSRVVFGQALRNCFIQGIINSVRTCFIGTLRERICLMYNGVVHIIGIAGCCSANVRIPCSQCPASCIVGIQRNGIGLIFNLLQVIQECIWCSRQFGNASFFKDTLIINNAHCIAHGGNAVNLAVKHLVAEEFVGILHIIVIADWFKISTKFTLVDSGRNHADVAPVTAGQPCGHIVCIVGNAFKADGDIWIQLLKFLCIFFKGGVYQVCPVGDHFQVCLQVRISRFQIDALVIQGSIFVCGVGAVAAVAAAAACHTCCHNGCQCDGDKLLFHNVFLQIFCFLCDICTFGNFVCPSRLGFFSFIIARFLVLSIG